MRPIAFFVLTLLASALFAAPHAVPIEPTKNVGRVLRGSMPVSDFVLRNDGDAPLTIVRVAPSCACTTATFDPVIAAGATGTIHVKLDTNALSGTVSKGLAVYTDDPAGPVQLVVKAQVQPRIATRPEYVSYAVVHGDPQTNAPKRIVVFSNDGARFRVLGGKSDVPTQKVTFREAAASEREPSIAGSQWILDVTLGDETPSGKISGRITVTTDDAQQPIVSVPVTGSVR